MLVEQMIQTQPITSSHITLWSIPSLGGWDPAEGRRLAG